VACHHDDRSAFVNLGENFADGPVDPDEDVKHWISHESAIAVFETRMVGVVEVPGLMADAMGFGKYLSEEIPIFLRQKVLGNGDLPVDTEQKSVSEFGQLGWRSMGVAWVTLGMMSK
jgi:hypothetical protein